MLMRLESAGEKLYANGEFGRILMKYMPFIPQPLRLEAQAQNAGP
ncbi:hypothetical protein IGB42_02254 [Andreprevotia sp. IGB-42]|nr:hypothetical protein [Andreprevotia sp. IGB-42]KAF0813325.1 hypothetical protein IGB42_02254 [Andreprevotia sp. IGB-42]